MRNLAAIFPKYAEIFNKNTIEGVWKFIQRYGEIEINTALLAEKLNTPESYLSRLNPEILSRITVLASYHNIHNTPDAEKIANKLLSPAATSNS